MLHDSILRHICNLIFDYLLMQEKTTHSNNSLFWYHRKTLIWKDDSWIKTPLRSFHLCVTIENPYPTVFCLLAGGMCSVWADWQTTLSCWGWFALKAQVEGKVQEEGWNWAPCLRAVENWDLAVTLGAAMGMYWNIVPAYTLKFFWHRNVSEQWEPFADVAIVV